MNRNENEKDPGLQDLLHVWKNQSKKSVPSNRKVQPKGKKRVHDNVVSEEKIEPEEKKRAHSNVPPDYQMLDNNDKVEATCKKVNEFSAQKIHKENECIRKERENHRKEILRKKEVREQQKKEILRQKEVREQQKEEIKNGREIIAVR